MITPWDAVENLISNHFKNFLNYDYLSQRIEDRHVYVNTELNCKFFHDFDKYNSLEKQLPLVTMKYEKRINNFFNDIAEPTIFIRYISNEEELNTIEKNYDSFLGLIKTYNKENEIIFIANRNLRTSLLDIYYVDIDEDDTVARKPLMQLENLERLLIDSIDPNIIEKNLNFSKNKKKMKKNIFQKINLKRKQKFVKAYEHLKSHPINSEIKIP